MSFRYPAPSVLYVIVRLCGLTCYVPFRHVISKWTLYFSKHIVTYLKNDIIRTKRVYKYTKYCGNMHRSETISWFVDTIRTEMEAQVRGWAYKLNPSETDLSQWEEYRKCERSIQFSRMVSGLPFLDREDVPTDNLFDLLDKAMSAYLLVEKGDIALAFIQLFSLHHPTKRTGYGFVYNYIFFSFFTHPLVCGGLQNERFSGVRNKLSSKVTEYSQSDDLFKPFFCDTHPYLLEKVSSLYA